MRVTFRNLGNIEHADLDVRPMTVIIGPNNTSKTYMAYSVYGLWNAIHGRGWPRPSLGLRKSGQTFLVHIDELTSRFLRALVSNVDSFHHNIHSYFQDTSRHIFAKTRLTVHPDGATVRSIVERDVSASRGGSIRCAGGQIIVELPDVRQVPRTWIESWLYEHISSALFPRPFVLPAERNAFVVTYKLLANRRFKLLRDQQRGLTGGKALAARQMELLREQGDLRYPTPIEDFLDFLIDIELNPPDSADAARKPFRALASDIESKIQGNNRTILVPTALGGQEVKVDVRDDLRIDLYNASSSIKQLAPLLLYLRYQAAPNQLLIIDEPEMNLHPEGQAKLLEALAILVNLGVHVLITTHSPYFMAHLNNLVAGDTKRPAVRKRQAQSLYLSDPRAFLSMDQVSAYEMKDNQLCSLKDEAYGIRWDTLSDVSVELQQRFFAIQEAAQARRGKKK